jgi:hypothetical protein
MKLYKKIFSWRHWLAYLRKQPKHMQHVYAAAFSGGFTLLLAMSILYFDYGFWRMRYVRVEETPATQQQVLNTQSPLDMMSSFFVQARSQLSSIGNSGTSLLEGKEVYTNDDSQTSEQSNLQSKGDTETATSTP